VPIEPTETIPPPFMGKVEVRLHPGLAGFEPLPGAPRVTGWFRFRDREPVDTLGLLVAVDAFPPTAFFADLPIAWVPTLELTTHVRARPAPGWFACSFSTRFISGGFLEEDGEVWDATGRLVAQSRQLALLPRVRMDVGRGSRSFPSGWRRRALQPSHPSIVSMRRTSSR
jgi:acyl-CoA thioesterase